MSSTTVKQRSLPFSLLVKRRFFFLVQKIFNLGSHKLYYSQTGEDIILEYLLPQKKGFYVDVGCYNPIVYSNTFKFYLKGWSGINIDANPLVCKEFEETRLRDTIVNTAISEEQKEVNYYVFGATEGVNTIDEKLIDEWKKHWDLTEVKKIQANTLSNVLQNKMPENQEIDLLTVDVEGHELSVLRSLDFDKYRPKVIVLEIHDFDLMNPMENEIIQFLDRQNYQFKFYATINVYFVDKNWVQK